MKQAARCWALVSAHATALVRFLAPRVTELLRLLTRVVVEASLDALVVPRGVGAAKRTPSSLGAIPCNI